MAALKIGNLYVFPLFFKCADGKTEGNSICVGFFFFLMDFTGRIKNVNGGIVSAKIIYVDSFLIYLCEKEDTI